MSWIASGSLRTRHSRRLPGNLIGGLLLLGGAILAFPHDVTARVWLVPGSAPTIQAAIDSTLSGDSVLVAPGTYYELLNIEAKAISLIGSSGPESTTVAGTGILTEEIVPLLQITQGGQGEVAGFTFTGMHDPAIDGAAIRCVDGADYDIHHNRFVDNSGVTGGAIMAGLSDVTIRDNEFVHNVAEYFGGGAIELFHCESVEIIHNIFSDNSAESAGWGGAIYVERSNCLIQSNVLTGNSAVQGAAIHVYAGSNVTIQENSLVANYNSQSGYPQASAIALRGEGSFPVIATVSNNIVAYSENLGGIARLASLGPTTVILDCNDVFMNDNGGYFQLAPGSSDLALDPEFCSLSLLDLRLSSSSPCLAANNDCGLIGALTEVCPATSGVGPSVGAARARSVMLTIRQDSQAWRLQYSSSIESFTATVRILDVTGRLVAEIPDQIVSDGLESVWTPRSSSGTALPSGVYFATVGQEREQATARILYLK